MQFETRAHVHSQCMHTDCFVWRKVDLFVCEKKTNMHKGYATDHGTLVSDSLQHSNKVDKEK